MRRGRRKVENPATARRILAAAEQKFAAQGLAGARTEEIASAAHANKAMLYYYFGDKRRLHHAVLENLFGQLRTLFEQLALAKTSPREGLIKFMDGYFEFIASHPNLPRLVQHEAMQSSREFEWILREFLKPFQQTMRGLILAGMERGEFRRVDPRHAVVSIIGMANFYFISAPRFRDVFGPDPLGPEALAERKRALVDLMLHGLLGPEARTP